MATVLAAGLAAAVAPRAAAQPESRRLYLSGRGPGEKVEWEIQISKGRRAGTWQPIVVPQQWEQEGFGTYAYGYDEATSDEVGRYRERFTVPAEWGGRRVTLVFEGVMTDADVRVNGHSAGPVHRGGFTPFSYDVSDVLRYGRENLLEVNVAERSADASVNRAERLADYWVFGGIYRPVYLRADPPLAIDRFEVDAQADGHLTARVWSAAAEPGARVELAVAPWPEQDPGQEPLWRHEAMLVGGVASFDGVVPSVETWTAETPHLYELRMSLLPGQGEALHLRRVKIGFRTVSLDPSEGLRINGRRVRLKGVNRHSFWPDSGRALDPERNRADAELIKSLHANAVRTSHYPPDEAFLDACDEIGLYVLDELPGWHDAYDTEVGLRILGEMVERDRRHPSVIVWTNGNEGGWNRHLDEEFGNLDLQARPVLHPDETFGGVDTGHYPSWRELADRLDDGRLDNRVRRLLGPLPLVLPTEALHGLWDGGGGAGLAGYWQLIESSPRGAGLFLWAFLDEAVARSDRGGALDTAANFAPDGVVGPYREPEASVATLRSVWAPVRLLEAAVGPTGGGSLRIENRFDHLDLDALDFELEWLAFPDAGEGEVEVIGEGGGRMPEAGPGEVAILGLQALSSAPRPADALHVVVRDSAHRSVADWVLPTAAAAERSWRKPVATEHPHGERRGDLFELREGPMTVEIDAASGTMRALHSAGTSLSLSGGPHPPGRQAAPVRSGDLEREGAAVRARFEGDGLLRSWSWTLDGSGWLRLDWRLEGETAGRLDGVLLDYPVGLVRGMRWLGRGPSRVWGNRRDGPTLGLWRKTANDTITGEQWNYPEFRGFHAGVRWAELETDEGRLLLVPGDPSLFLNLFAPSFPEGRGPDGESLARGARAEVADGVGLLHSISAIGTKFHTAAELAPPENDRERTSSPRSGRMWLRFLPAESGDGAAGRRP